MGEVVYAPHTSGRSLPADHADGAPRVLIVDADPATLAAISQALETEGHATAAAFDTPGAIAIAQRSGPFQLLVVDVASADALTVASALRALDHNLRVLYVTSHGDNGPLPLLDEDEVIRKPFSESELVDAVSSLLYWQAPRSTR